MGKEILGYKVKPEFAKYARKLVKNKASSKEWINHNMNFQPCDSWTDTFKAAGVLDLWFEPVYKEPEFEFGRWYKSNIAGNSLFFISDKYTGYGFGLSGKWEVWNQYGWIPWVLDKFTPATNAEVEERLLAYAKEHYPVGTKFKSANSSDQIYEVSDPIRMWVNKKYAHCEAVANGEYGLLYIKGKWAEIIPEPDIEDKLNEVSEMLQKAIDKLNELRK